MKISAADVATVHSSRYLRQLCRHWSHKFPVHFDDRHGRIELPSTVCIMDAGPENLSVKLEIQDGEDQARMEQVVAEHLQRFGFQEQLLFDWRRS